MTRVAASQIRDQISSTLERVSREGERVVIEHEGRGVAALVPMEDLERLERLDDRAEARAPSESNGELRRRSPLPFIPAADTGKPIPALSEDELPRIEEEEELARFARSSGC